MSDASKIGYGRPPTEHRFKKGQSGNPKGRPKRKPLVLGETISNVMHGPTFYTVGDQKKTAPRSEVSMRALIKRGVEGDIGAADQIYRLLKNAARGAGDTTLRVRVEGWLPDFPGQTGRQKEFGSKAVSAFTSATVATGEST